MVDWGFGPYRNIQLSVIARVKEFGALYRRLEILRRSASVESVYLNDNGVHGAGHSSRGKGRQRQQRELHGGRVLGE